MVLSCVVSCLCSSLHAQVACLVGKKASVVAHYCVREGTCHRITTHAQQQGVKMRWRGERSKSPPLVLVCSINPFVLVPVYLTCRKEISSSPFARGGARSIPCMPALPLELFRVSGCQGLGFRIIRCLASQPQARTRRKGTYSWSATLAPLPEDRSVKKVKRC